MNIGDILKDQYEQGHAILDGVMADVDPELVNRETRLGTLGSIGSIFAHMVFTEDGIMSGAQGKPTLYESAGWDKRIQIPTPGIRQTAEWAAGVKLDLPVFKDYAKEVFAATEKYVASLSGDDLEREMTGLAGRPVKLAMMIGTVGTIHVAEHTGEIAAIKGMHGLKGLPF